MDFKEMDMAALEARKAVIAEECEKEGADLDALLEEARGINAEIEERKALEAKQVELRAAVAAGAGEVINTVPEEEKKMDLNEIRSSHEYNVAYANYIKTGKDDECRGLLTINAVSGTVPVPTFVDNTVRTAWERDGITRLVKKTYLKGNLKVGFEISSTGATKHTEGGAGVAEETLVLGVAELKPVSIKKWISISDEAYDLAGEEFLAYIYDELTYQIAKKAADELLDIIIACDTESTTTQVAVSKITSTQVTVDLVAQAIGGLKDTRDEVVVLNRATWAALKSAQYANKYAVDPFEGREVIFNDHIQAFSACSTGDTYMIVGDFANGAQMNFPNGNEVGFKFDDLTLASSDMIRIIGREFVGINAVKPYAFAQVVK